MKRPSLTRLFDDGLAVVDFDEAEVLEREVLGVSAVSQDPRQQLSTARISLTSLAVTVGIVAWAIANAWLGG